MNTRFPVSRYLKISIALAVVFLTVGKFHTSASSGNGTGNAALQPAAPLVGIFYTVTGTADNTDVVIHGGTGTIMISRMPMIPSGNIASRFC